MKAIPTTELAQNHEKNEDHKDNSCKFSQSPNDLGRECKDPLSSSRDWNGTSSRMNKDTSNHGGSKKDAGRDVGQTQQFGDGLKDNKDE